MTLDSPGVLPCDPKFEEEKEIMSSPGNHEGDDGLLTAVLSSLGFACLLGWELTLVFAPSLPMLSFCSLQEAIALRVTSVLALAVSYAFCAWKANWVLENRRRLFALGAVLALAALANTGANFVFGGVPLATSVVGWVFFGAAQASITIFWCIFFSVVPARRTPVAVTVGSLLGTMLYVFINAGDFVWLNLAGVMLLVVGSVGVAAFLSSRLPQGAVLPVGEYHRSPKIPPKAALSVACHGVIYGFMSIQLCTMGPAEALVGGASGILGTLLALLWGVLGSRVDIDAGIVQRISLPILVASVLLFPFFDGWGRVACACLANMALAHNTLFTWYSSAVENQEFRLHPIDRFAMRQVPSQLGFFAGSMLAYAIIFVVPLDGWGLSFAMAVMAIVVVAVFSAYGGNESSTRARLDALLLMTGESAADLVRKESGDIDSAGLALASGAEGVAEASAKADVPDVEGTPDAEGASGRGVGFERSCAGIAAKYALTAREGEVFALLAKGRNAAFISSQLGVSPSTIKSHIYHIYQKLGVNSQQNLLDVLDGFEEEQ